MSLVIAFFFGWGLTSFVSMVIATAFSCRLYGRMKRSEPDGRVKVSNGFRVFHITDPDAGVSQEELDRWYADGGR